MSKLTAAEMNELSMKGEGIFKDAKKRIPIPTHDEPFRVLPSPSDLLPVDLSGEKMPTEAEFKEQAKLFHRADIGLLVSELVIDFFLRSRTAWFIYGLIIGIVIEHYFGPLEFMF